MRLSVAQVNELIADSPASAKGLHSTSAEDYQQATEEHKLATVRSFAEQQNQSSARFGEELPPPPKNLRTIISGSNDFGADNTPTRQGQTPLGSPAAVSPNSHPSGINPDGSVALTPYHEILPPETHSIVPRALLGVDLTKTTSRAELLYGLIQNIPMNEMGLPRIIYSPDLLDYTQFGGVVPTDVDAASKYRALQDLLDVATIHLTYAEGFPALPNGAPLWGRLPFETPEAFDAFLQYCELPGARQTAMLVKWPHTTVLEWYHTNYWAIRAKCFDMMHNVHMARLREQRILTCEDSHYKKADALLTRMQQLEQQVDWDQLKSDPKAYIEVLEKLTKLQRTALGLQEAAKGKEARETKTESLEVAMRRAGSSDEPLKLKDDQIGVRSLLRNPDALATAQELIVRMTRTTTTTREEEEAA